jgi:hypothetical protein
MGLTGVFFFFFALFLFGDLAATSALVTCTVLHAKLMENAVFLSNMLFPASLEQSVAARDVWQDG